MDNGSFCPLHTRSCQAWRLPQSPPNMMDREFSCYFLDDCHDLGCSARSNCGYFLWLFSEPCSPGLEVWVGTGTFCFNQLPDGDACSTKLAISLLSSHPAHPFGPTRCSNPYGSGSLFHLSSTGHGLSSKLRCWWKWEGDCVVCSRRVKPMRGIFCGNFCYSRGGWTPCRSVWHAECYTCLGQEMPKFPRAVITDEVGNV